MYTFLKGLNPHQITLVSIRNYVIFYMGHNFRICYVVGRSHCVTPHTTVFGVTFVSDSFISPSAEDRNNYNTYYNVLIYTGTFHFLVHAFDVLVIDTHLARIRQRTLMFLSIPPSVEGSPNTMH